MERTVRARRGRRRGKVSLGPRESRRLLQLGVCILLFLTVFFCKGLLPDSAAQRLGQLLRGDADLEAVLAGMGQAFSQGEPVLPSLSRLLGQEESSQVRQVSAPYYEQYRSQLLRRDLTATGLLELDLSLSDPAPVLSLSPADPLPSQAPDSQPEETADPQQQEEQPQSDQQVIHVDYDGPAMPAGATMDQYLLPLTCTVSPVQGAEGWWISSPFGWREHPVDGEERFHNGVDLAVNTGTQVKAFADGTVDYIGESDIYGLYTQIRHQGGVTTFYAHCSQLLVQKGQQVTAGQVIALSGETGNVTGPHLHFELKQDGVLLNPLYYMAGPDETGQD